VRAEHGVRGATGPGKAAVQRIAELEVGAVHDVGGEDGVMHGEQQGHAPPGFTKLTDQPVALRLVELPPVGNAGVQPDDREPRMFKRPVDVRLVLCRPGQGRIRSVGRRAEVSREGFKRPGGATG
jgi:hypothetical protein